ncbi:MAG: hypothetical protein ACT4OG_01435 [Alphaproteobacteria bacterium]
MNAAVKRTLLLLAVAFGTPAGASTFLPPSNYDRPYPGLLRVVTLPYWTVSKRCGVRPYDGHRAEACAFRGPNTCLIVLPEVAEVGEEEAALLLRHEIAHCNGWPHHHPSAHF